MERSTFDFGPRYPKLQSTVQEVEHMDLDDNVPTICVDMTPAQYSSPPDSVTHIRPGFLYPGMPSINTPYTPPITPPPSQEMNIAGQHRASQHSESFHGPTSYASYYPVAHTNAGLVVPIHDHRTPPPSPGVHPADSTVLLSCDKGSSCLARNTTSEYTNSGQTPVLVEHRGTDPYSTCIPSGAFSTYDTDRSALSPRRGSSNGHLAATGSIYRRRSVSGGSNHSNHTAGPERCHQCEFCGAWVKALGRHMQDMHRDISENPPALLDCPDYGCDRKGRKGFKRKDNLTQHLRNVHGLDIPKRGRQ
ncbi:hypothetical protein K440DRAFT_657406 [Wilcoxina mikolae CBS 423.85]|nr:hypothetical protein K440DRAFT_657406 [Wilcoxina mikolae CBS 423.85]